MGLMVIASVIGGVVSCSSSTTTTSDDARVSGFTFYSDTANPGLTTATYKIIHSTDTGLIYNKDSLDFGTRLDSVLPYISFYATPGSAVLIFPDTIRNYTGSDTLDFTKQPIYLYVMASDMKNERMYQLSITVHQVDPYLYVWRQTVGQIFPSENAELQAFATANGCYLFVNNGFETRLYLSQDGVVWQTQTQPTGLPVPCHVRQIVQVNETLYYVSKGNIYSSQDVVHWSMYDTSTSAYEPLTMLVSFDDCAWCVMKVRDTGQLVLGYLADGTLTLAEHIDGLPSGYILPDDFPVSDFAALPISASSERPRSMIIGGRSIDGTALNSRWNLEKDADHHFRIRNFSIEQPSFHSLCGISVIEYDQKLLMFGGIDNDEDWHSDLLESIDEGMNWTIPDSAENQLPDTYTSREKQTVVVDKENNIYIIGGQTATQCLSDVHKGYLMSINWE